MNFSIIFILFVCLATVNGTRKINWNRVKQHFLIRKTLIPDIFQTIQTRIVNGQDVLNIEDYPYQAGILTTLPDRTAMWCGGSLISNKWILTAAHCLQDAVKSTIYLGTLNANVYAPTMKEFRVDRSAYFIHDKFNQALIQNDIALIKLPEPVQFSDAIRPISLVHYEDSKKTKFDGQPAFVSGWGVISDSLSKDTLQYAIVLIVSEEKCKKYFGDYVGPKNICQSGDEVKGICPGDSGGPLVAYGSDGTKVLIGVSSFISGNGCEAVAPRVATRVSAYMDWIISIVANNE